MSTETGTLLAALSRWVDDHPANAARSSESQLWGRTAKIAEENGEVIAAIIGATGQNPRKGVTHTMDDVVAELLDVAVTALAAVEHIVGNDGSSMRLLNEKIAEVAARAGVS
jgi:hypothetical protein